MLAQPRPSSSKRPAIFLLVHRGAWHGGRLAMGRRARSDADVADACAARGLAVSPGRSCFAGEPPGSYLRLSYAAADPGALARGAEILAEVVEGP